MNTTLTEISNIFNLMVQADSRLKFYHFGWRSDINKNIDNNFDKGVKTGRLFPALHFDVPDFFQPSEELNYLGFKEDIQINLYFDDLQNYDNSGEQKTDTLIEQWAALKQTAEDFINNLSEVLQYYKAGFIRTVPRFEPKSNLFNDRLLTFEVSFTLSHFSECTEESNKINLLSLPAASFLPSYDIENYLKDLQVCKSILLDGVNESINCTNNSAFDLERTDTFTVSAWIKIQSFPLLFSPIVSKFDRAIKRGLQLGIESTGQVRFILANNTSPANYIYAQTNISLLSNEWYNIIITYNGSSDISGVKIYINGQIQNFAIIGNNLNSTILNSANLNISNIDNSFFFNGNVANIRIWNLEITSLQVSEEYNLGTILSPAVEAANLILNTDIENATWNGTAYEIPDLTGITEGYISVNSEESDLLTDCP